MREVGFFEVVGLDVGEVFVSAMTGMTQTVVEKRTDGTVLTSADGKRWHRGVWHDGAESDSGVWVEVFDAGGSVFHGVVDEVSRKVVQVG